MHRVAHFGLGNIQKVDRAEILWLDGTKTTIYNPDIDKKHYINKKAYQNSIVENVNLQYPFVDVSRGIGISDFKHEENNYNDYKTEILLPHKQSTLGPCVAVGDINGDGNEDFMLEEQKVKQDKYIFKILKEDLLFLHKMHSVKMRILKISAPYFLMLIMTEI